MGMHIPDEGNIFTPMSGPLVELLGDINTHKTALPDFQRPWVWEPQMVRDLLISVAHRYPAGSLLTMPISSATFALRTFEGAGDLRATDQPRMMVLDGQQRLTSLYQALYRRDGVRFKKRAFYFYLDVAQLLAGDDASDNVFADALFYVVQEKNDKRVRYDGLAPRYELTTREHELASGALPLNVMFDVNGALSSWKDSYLEEQSDRDWDRYKSIKADWDRLVQPWLDRIRTYPFPVVELRQDMSLGAICHIFEKVNSTGVPLDVFDLCTAILWAQGYSLNEEWAKTRRRMEQTNLLLMQPKPLSGTHFLQGIALLDSLERKRANPGQRIAVACRKEDLMKLDVATVKRWWPLLVEGYQEASSFLTNQGVLSERILPYTTLIIPLSAMLADLRRRKGEAHVAEAWPKVARWYWCSVLTQRYSSQVESAAALDLEQTLSWVDGVGEAPDVVRTFSFRPDALQEITSIRNAIYKGILCLLARVGAEDFGGKGKLSIALFYDSQQDHHHIFPTEALRQMGIKDPRGDAIVNKTLISAAVNRSIGSKRPSEYAASLSKGDMGVSGFDAILRSHRIDPGALRADNWEEFVLTRREQLRQLIVSACGAVQPFSAQSDEPVVPVTIFDADDESEDLGA